MQESTKLSVNEKHLQMLGNLHLKAVNAAVEPSEQRNEHLKLALSSFISLLCTCQPDNEYYLQGCLKVLGILFQYSHLEDIQK